jgi:hypothetical protein
VRRRKLRAPTRRLLDAAVTTLHHRTPPDTAENTIPPRTSAAGSRPHEGNSPDDDPQDERAHGKGSHPPKEPARLSLTQVVASGLAAVSTTVLLSLFGVAGTIIGAGLASVLTVVANFLYTRSIEKTHAQLKPVVGTIQTKTAITRVVALERRDVTATVPVVPPAGTSTDVMITDGAAAGENLASRFKPKSPVHTYIVRCFASGSMLWLVASTLFPEAYEEAGHVVGVVTTIGFLVAYVLSRLE